MRRSDMLTPCRCAPQELGLYLVHLQPVGFHSPWHVVDAGRHTLCEVVNLGRFTNPQTKSKTYIVVLRGCQTNDKIGWFYLPTKSPDKNLLCVMQKLPDFVSRQNHPILSAKIEHVLSSTILSADFFVYRTTNFVYVAMVIVYNERWIFILVIYCVCYFFRSLDAEKSDATIILRSAFDCCASWYRTK